MWQSIWMHAQIYFQIVCKILYFRNYFHLYLLLNAWMFLIFLFIIITFYFRWRVSLFATYKIEFLHFPYSISFYNIFCLCFVQTFNDNISPRRQNLTLYLYLSMFSLTLWILQIFLFIILDLTLCNVKKYLILSTYSALLNELKWMLQ